MKIKTRRAKQWRSLGGERIFVQDPQNSDTPVLALENFYPDARQENLLEKDLIQSLKMFTCFW